MQGFIRDEPFDPKTWSIPGDKSGSLKIKGLDSNKGTNIFVSGKRKLKRKIIADVVEALIGAYLSTGGEKAALWFMDWVGIKVNFNTIPYERQFSVHPEKLVNVRFLQSLLNYSFRDNSLLVEALTHGSYMLPEIPRCYQVLTVVIIHQWKTYISMHRYLCKVQIIVSPYGLAYLFSCLNGAHKIVIVHILLHDQLGFLHILVTCVSLFSQFANGMLLQRLEFLGDSALDYLITVHLYNKYPGLSPGQLTDMRAASVNNDFYAWSAIKAGLHKHVLHASQELHKHIVVTLRALEKLSSESPIGWESETSFPKVSCYLIICCCHSFVLR